jgi:peptide methionine sulfoxide reductase MsrA
MRAVAGFTTSDDAQKAVRVYQFPRRRAGTARPAKKVEDFYKCENFHKLFLRESPRFAKYLRLSCNSAAKFC